VTKHLVALVLPRTHPGRPLSLISQIRSGFHPSLYSCRDCKDRKPLPTGTFNRVDFSPFRLEHFYICITFDLYYQLEILYLGSSASGPASLPCQPEILSFPSEISCVNVAQQLRFDLGIRCRTAIVTYCINQRNPGAWRLVHDVEKQHHDIYSTHDRSRQTELIASIEIGRPQHCRCLLSTHSSSI
jgi:hypothetical protein